MSHMEVLFLLSVVVVTAGELNATSSPPTEGDIKAALLGNSLVSGLLLASGFSDTCVATALETCAPVSEQRRPPPLVQVRARIAVTCYAR